MTTPEQEKEFVNSFLALAESGDTDEVSKVAHDAFADEQNSESLLAFIAGVIYERQLEKPIQLIPQFTKRFPDSLHPISVFLGDLYARGARLDEATLEARIYLRRIRDAQYLDKLDSDKLIAHGVSMAFLLFTSAFTELGARSYSQSILTLAQQYVKDPHWIGVYENEIQRLSDELKEPDNQANDERWQACFNDGSYMAELEKQCMDSGYTILAKYVVAIEGKHRYNADYKVTPESVFDVLIKSEDSFGLA